MLEVAAPLGSRSSAMRAIVAAWLVTALYYFYQYALRSAPAVMMPQLTDAFGLTTMGVASLVGLFYYGYSPFSLVAGAAMDTLGPRRVVPIGAAAVGVGALLFATGNNTLASAGRFLQGAGGVFALVGAAYIATTNFPASRAATLIGATQMFGMAGGSAGQFVVGPLIARGVPWQAFWVAMGVIGLLMSAFLYALLPGRANIATPNADLSAVARSAKAEGPRPKADTKPGVLHSFATVFRNPQSILCGMIAGLLFIPTTIFDMVWGVRFLQDARGFEYGDAVLRSSLVPLGWIIGCPLLGFVSDRIGRRKPVIAASGLVLFVCLGWILYGPVGLLPPYVLGLVAGVVSGAAMLPYTVIKEANPPEMSGTSTGVVNFLNFTFSALLGPAFGWILLRVSGGSETMTLSHYQATFYPLLYGVALAVLLTFLLRETGPAARRAPR